MTRGPIPRFDLYEELEVSRLASAEVIEAAYRTLVKRHHPDVATANGAAGEGEGSGGTSPDADRIKRLNVAKSWLTDPARRARYDDATADAARAKAQVQTPGSSRRAAVADAASPAAQEPAPMGFGPNSAEVRRFLADLRPLDVARARQVLAAKATMPSTPYQEARGFALRASRAGRHEQWLLARDAATVIVQGKLGDWPQAKEVAAIVADAVGALVVRDLVPLTDFQLLLRPWTWRPEPTIAAGPAATGVVAVRLADMRIAAGAAVRGRESKALGVAASAVVAVIALGAILFAPAKPNQAVAALTYAPSGLTAAASPAGPSSPDGVPPTESSGSPAPASPFASGALAEPTGSGTVPSATPRVTWRPTATVPLPSTVPSPSVIPTATTVPPSASTAPTPVPSPSLSPPIMCLVVNLVGVNTSNAQLTWNTAGFTGTVLFNPAIPRHYKIGWQSLTVGTDILCTSDITVTP